MKLEVIFTLLLTTYTTFQCTNSSEITNSSTEMWKLHMELYTTHCGEPDFCGNNTGYMIPAGFPCCLPCSCLPSCEQQHNCCPKIEDESENLIETRRKMDEKDVNQPNNSVGDRTRHTTRNTLQTTAISVQVTAHTKRSQGDEPNRNLTPTLADDDELTEREIGVTPTCFRPQVVNRPNWYLESDAYLMIAECRGTYKDSEIKDKCESAMNKTDLWDMLPVTSRLTGLSYANRFCLMCNEPTSPNPFVWEAKYVEIGHIYHTYHVFNPNELIEFAKYYGNIHFTPAASHPVQQCESYAISTCNVTGLWDRFDDTIVHICHRGQYLPILHKSMRFKNIACLHCNEGDNFYDILSCGFWIDLNSNDEKYSLTLNVRKTAPDGKTEKGLIHESYLRKAVLPLPKTKPCPPGYTALLGYCRRVICPRDKYISNNKCVPLYQSITGMDLGVQIDVHTSKPIPKEFASYFLDELTKMYNASLFRYVTLQIRHISVWFGPKGTKAEDKYYMFDLYLFNKSDTIDYSVAVNEIKNFFRDLESHKSIELLDGTEIGLSVTFNHRLEIRRYRSSPKANSSFVQWDTSTTASGRLNPMVGSYFPPKRHMRISDVIWCYRVAFAQFEDLYEVQWLSSDACLIKPTDTIVYKPQYESIVTNPMKQSVTIGHHYNLVYYFCLDLFTDHMQNSSVGTKTNVDKSPTSLDEKSSDSSEMTSRISIIIVVALGTLVLIIGACLVIRKTGQAGVRNGELSGDQTN